MFVPSRRQLYALVCSLLVGCGGTPPPIEPVQPAETRLTLDQTNTRVNWIATRRIMGKTVQLCGGWDDTGKISGMAIRAADGAIRQLTATIEVASLWTEHDLLAEIMRKPGVGFFATDRHPIATFISTAIKVDTPRTNSSHVVEGRLQLNGIEHPIAFPAMIKTVGGGLQFESKFTLNRHTYNSRLVNAPAGLMLGDKDILDEVALSVNIHAPPDGVVANNPVAKTVDLSSLPKTFTQTVGVFQVRFDMVLVPGEESRGIKPLYVGKHEVTWDEFLPWVHARDLSDPFAAGRLRAKKLRPTLPYGDITRGYGTEGFPAISMTKLAAERYCQWLSEQTGLKYRLPTEKEWERIYQLGRGGKSSALTDDEAAKVAVYEANSFVDENGNYQTRAVGSKAADLLGLHDMAGNVAEWVDDTGEEQKVCGGHFKCGFAQLGGHEIVWGDQGWPGVPQEPRSAWWFRLYTEVGFRVVCDP